MKAVLITLALLSSFNVLALDSSDLMGKVFLGANSKLVIDSDLSEDGTLKATIEPTYASLSATSFKKSQRIEEVVISGTSFIGYYSTDLENEIHAGVIFTIYDDVVGTELCKSSDYGRRNCLSLVR